MFEADYCFDGKLSQIKKILYHLFYMKTWI